MINFGDGRDPRPQEWGNFAANAGFYDRSAALQYTGTPQGGEWNVEIFGDDVLFGSTGGLGSILDAVLSVGWPTIFGGGTPTIPRIQLPQVVIPDFELPDPYIPSQRGASTDANPRPYYDEDGNNVSVMDQRADAGRQINYGQPGFNRDYGTINDTEIPIIDEDEDMAIDWGNLISGGIDLLQGQQPGGGIPNFTVPLPAGGIPQRVTIDTVTGKVTPCRRRRRRRLLTPTDLSDLAALATIVGKGDALKLATVKAVRR